MAKAPDTTSDVAGTETRKRRAPSGPRKNRPFHVALRITDSNGNPVEGAKFEIGVISRDLAEVVDFVDASPEYKRFKLDIPSKEAAE